MPDEKGYVQFTSSWQYAAPPGHAIVDDLIHWRDRLCRLGLIGVYPDGIGFGNLSGRIHGHEFVITGTGTGKLATLTPAQFCTVTAFAIADNHVTCAGPVQASSEAMSHAAVYVAEPMATVVIHVHHLGLWQKWRDRLPTTRSEAEAGTPAMGQAITDLFTTGVPGGVFVMGGHREGLMAFGTTAAQAGERIVQLYEAYGCR